MGLVAVHCCWNVDCLCTHLADHTELAVNDCGVVGNAVAHCRFSQVSARFKQGVFSGA